MPFDEPDAGMKRLIAWAETQPLVRAMILTSTMAVPGAPVDIFSDYDPILILSDMHPYFESQDWLDYFGQVLVYYRDPMLYTDGFENAGYVVQFEDGSKIDFTLWPVELLRHVAALPELPEELDAGYRVLLDKDGLTANLKPPTHQGYIPKKPTLEQFLSPIQEFFLDATYAAKMLWRDDLMAAKHLMEYHMKQEHLRPVLEWHCEILHDWKWRPGPYGRRMKKSLRPDLWIRLESTWTGAGLSENWAALFATMELMLTAGTEVGLHLGYVYPEEQHLRIMTHLRKVKNLNRQAMRPEF